MHLFDVILSVDGEGNILSIEWRSEELRLFFDSFEALRGTSIHVSLGVKQGEESGAFFWNGEKFSYERLRAGERFFYCIKRVDHQKELLRAALDTLPESIQVYDADARAVYFNRASRDISGFADTAHPEGKYVLDIYSGIEEEYSTTLTTLRTKKPVYHRFAEYKTADGKSIVALNSGFPVFLDKKLAGAVIHEQNIAIVQDKIRRLEDLKAAMVANASGGARQYRMYSFSDIIGRNKKMREAVELAEKVSFREGNVLLVGETGTGKEIFARSIHTGSSRRNGRFVSINCAAVPETLVESILFGTTRGAFTGSQDKAGLFEEACDGTLFLDELNSMSISMQSKILRVLQEQTFRRIGGTKDLHTNARIISACNEDPYQLVEQNRLRRDLFYRLGTILINIPPLREHREDIEELAFYHLREAAPQYAINVQRIDPTALALLCQYDWPGNVRELNHALDYAMNLCTGEVLLPEYLPPHLQQERLFSSPAREERREDDVAPGRLQDSMDAYEDKLIRAALRVCGGNISKAAQLLDIKRQSLQYRIHKYGIVI